MRKKILCLVRGENRERFVEPLDRLWFDVITSEDWNASVIDQIGPQLVLSIGESNYEIFNCFKRARELGIPTLTIQDGIPEWRDMFSNPKYTAGDRLPNRQFMIADKVTCFGINHVNLFNAYGMYGQTELVGYPLFDSLVKSYLNNFTSEKSNKLLIMTANTPFFNSAEKSLVEQSLVDINDWLKHQDYWKPIWRVRRINLKALGIEEFNQAEGDLHQIISESGAVISTPSTVLIESMLYRKPVIVLDYNNCPLFVDAVWKITAPVHIEKTLTEIKEPSSQRMKYQDIILSQWLYISDKETATSRLNNLIKEMVKSFEEGKALNSVILKEETSSTIKNLKVTKSQLSGAEDLFPHHSVFSNNELIKLQLEAANLKEENKILRRALLEKNLKNILLLLKVLKKSKLN